MGPNVASLEIGSCCDVDQQTEYVREMSNTNRRFSLDANRNRAHEEQNRHVVSAGGKNGSCHADGQVQLKECEFGSVSTQLWCDRSSQWRCSFAVCFVSVKRGLAKHVLNELLLLQTKFVLPITITDFTE